MPHPTLTPDFVAPMAEGAEGPLFVLVDGLHPAVARRLGLLMQQAEHWAENGKPLAVHHRLQKSDAYFQIVALFERHMRGEWGDSFDYMALHMDRAQVKPHGAYPCSAELHRYNDVRFVVAELERTA
jgi:hypothetical protein